MNNIDYNKLRRDLIDYYGTGSMYHPEMIILLTKLENCSNQELIAFAISNNINIENYIIDNKIRLIK